MMPQHEYRRFGRKLSRGAIVKLMSEYKLSRSTIYNVLRGNNAVHPEVLEAACVMLESRKLLEKRMRIAAEDRLPFESEKPPHFKNKLLTIAQAVQLTRLNDEYLRRQYRNRVLLGRKRKGKIYLYYDHLQEVYKDRISAIWSATSD
jgi:hypothetical protein